MLDCPDVRRDWLQVRTMATALAEDGKRVKVCVQEAMGAGVFQVHGLHRLIALISVHVQDGVLMSQ